MVPDNSDNTLRKVPTISNGNEYDKTNPNLSIRTTNQNLATTEDARIQSLASTKWAHGSPPPIVVKPEKETIGKRANVQSANIQKELTSPPHLIVVKPLNETIWKRAKVQSAKIQKDVPQSLPPVVVKPVNERIWTKAKVQSVNIPKDVHQSPPTIIVKPVNERIWRKAKVQSANSQEDVILLDDNGDEGDTMLISYERRAVTLRDAKRKMTEARCLCGFVATDLKSQLAHKLLCKHGKTRDSRCLNIAVGCGCGQEVNSMELMKEHMAACEFWTRSLPVQNRMKNPKLASVPRQRLPSRQKGNTNSGNDDTTAPLQKMKFAFTRSKNSATLVAIPLQEKPSDVTTHQGNHQ